jgi:RHS repeat-associated protein
MTSGSFTGGQCPVLYTVCYEIYIYSAPNNQGWYPACSPPLEGPITAVELRVPSGGSGTKFVAIDHANGTSYYYGGGRYDDLRNITVTRNDGQPDDCGDPPSSTPQPLDPNLICPNEPATGLPRCPASFPINSEVVAKTGGVIETQDLVTYNTLGATRGLTLRYDSLTADARPILHCRYNQVTNPNRVLIAKLTVNRGPFSTTVPGYTGNQYGLTGNEHFWKVPSPAPTSGIVDGALQVDLSNQPSGSYSYTFASGIQPYTTGTPPQFSPLPNSQPGSFVHINRRNSSFGKGWALVGWQELILNPDNSLLLLDGDGTQQLFTAPVSGTLYTSPPGDFSRLERQSDNTFRRTLEDGTRYSFNLDLRLATVQDRNGNLTRYLYNSTGQLTQILDPVNLATTFTYTGSLVTSITDPGNRITRLEYLNGNLTKIIHPDTAEYRYEYDANSRMTASINARGNRGETRYDFAGRATGATRRDGSTVQIQAIAVQGLYPSAQTIDPLNPALAFSPAVLATQTARYTDGNGNVMMMELNQQGDITIASDGIGSLGSSVYNAQNLVTQRRNGRGQATDFEYDSRGNVTKILDSLSGADGRRFEYEPTFNQLTRVLDELGRETRYTLDANNGNVLTLTQVVGALGGTDDRVTVYTYTPQGLVDTLTDPLGRITNLDYNAQGRLITVTLAQGTPEQAILRYTYDGVGNVATSTDALGRQTRYFYDTFNRLIRVEQPDPDGTGPITPSITQMGYDLNGNLIRVEDALGNVTRSEYDALDRLTRTLQPDPDGPIPGGNRPETVYAYDAGGNLRFLTDPLNQVTEYRYDARDRQTQIIDALSQITNYSYDIDDNLIRVTDPLNHQTQFVYDARNRLTSQTDALNRVTQFVYDAVDNLLSLTDPLNNITRYSYDALNQTTVETNPLNFTRLFEYDRIGNLTKLTDRNSRVRSFNYDNLNRLLTERWLNSSGTAIHTITATYDIAGQLTRISDPNATYAYTYDNAGRLTSVSNAGTPNFLSGSLEATYNAVGSRRTLTEILNGQTRGTVTFGYDDLQRLVNVSQSGTSTASKRVNFRYDRKGQITRLNRFASADNSTPLVVTNLDYDPTGLITQIQHSLGNTVLSNNTWNHDVASRVTQFTNPDGSSAYSYDNTDQLTATNHSYQTDEAYSYDTNGNRTNAGYATGTNNRLLNDGTYTYTYDNEGNRIGRSRSGEIVTYLWDHRNRLTRVEFRTTAGGAITKSASYTYDPLDRRIVKTIDPDGAGPNPATIERYVYDRDHIWLCFDGNNTLTNRYLYGPTIDMALADDRITTAVRWMLTDNQGTVRDISNNAGAVQNHIRYDSFGKITSQTNANFNTRFNYTGREFDAETGLYYYRSRYYDANLGRFINEDLIGFAGGDANLYRYVGNSPVNTVDPFGLAPKTGNCTYEQWAPLHDQKVKYCDNPKFRPSSCDRFKEKKDIEENIRKFNACLNARKILSETCFKGIGDKGHEIKEEELLNGIRKCIDKLNQIKREEANRKQFQIPTIPMQNIPNPAPAIQFFRCIFFGCVPNP